MTSLKVQAKVGARFIEPVYYGADLSAPYHSRLECKSLITYRPSNITQLAYWLIAGKEVIIDGHSGNRSP